MYLVLPSGVFGLIRYPHYICASTYTLPSVAVVFVVNTFPPDASPDFQDWPARAAPLAPRGGREHCSLPPQGLSGSPIRGAGGEDPLDEVRARVREYQALAPSASLLLPPAASCVALKIIGQYESPPRSRPRLACVAVQVSREPGDPCSTPP